MDSKLTGSAARVAMFAIGAVLAIALLVAAKPSSEVPGAPAEVSMSVPSSGELAVRPAAPERLMKASLMPGEQGSASFEVGNQTGSSLVVSLRAEPSSSELDGQLEVRIEASGRTLAETTLGSLRHASMPLALDPGSSAKVDVTVGLPGGATGFEGRVVDVDLLTRTEVAR